MAITVLRDELFFLGAFFAIIIMGENTSLEIYDIIKMVLTNVVYDGVDSSGPG
jgi:hypothetical protein